MTMNLALLLQDDTAGAIAGLLAGGMFMLVFFGILIVVIASMWKVFTKAGKPGWAAIIPIYNTITLLEIVGRPAWWFILMIIPLVSLVVALMVVADLAKAFGKSGAWGVFLLGLFPIGWLILGFGSARYVGLPGTTSAVAAGSGY
jgi:hypothetical protein